jgi:predicted secreted protein
MPPPLVHAVAAHHGVQPGGHVEPTQVYVVARDMRVSYEAAARQLTELGFLPPPERDRLLKVSPLSAKKAIAHGVRPIVGNADVWPIDEQSNGVHLDVLVNDEIVVALPENRTTGYRWMTPAARVRRDRHRRRPPPPAFAEGVPPGVDSNALTRAVAAGLARSAGHRDLETPSDGESPLRVVADHYAQGWSDLRPRAVQGFRRRLREARGADRGAPGIGATGRRWLSLQAHDEGTWRYELEYASPHEAFAPPAMAFSFEATVHPDPTVERRRAILRVDFGDEPASPLALE